MSASELSFPGPDDVTRQVFDNGMTVLVRENPAAPVVVLEGSLPAGSIHDPAGKSGLSSFTASMLTRGSANYDFVTFNETIESVGASLSVNSGDHVTNFSTNSLTEDFPMLVEVLADVLRTPTFPLEHVERVRGQRLIRLQERDQNTRSVAYIHFNELLYGEHPYGRPGSGYPETIQAISREDLEAFYRQRYTPNGAIIVVSGDVRSQDVLELVERYWADWSGEEAEQALPPVVEQQEIQRKFVAMPGKIQSDIVVGNLSISRTDPNYYAVQVANNILGRFGLMGRLGEVVREKQGLAYYSYSVLDTDVAAGAWLAAAGVNPANVERAAESILGEFARLAGEAVSAEELSDSQANMTGALPLRLETNEGVASALLDMEWYGLGLDYLVHYGQRVNAVTVEDVQRVAAQYLRPDAYTLVVAGPDTDT